MKFPVVELVDRYTIALVKHKKLGGKNQEEIDFYTEQMTELDVNLIESELLDLIKVHEQIWAMEDDFKKYRAEVNYDMAEIGRRALEIRDLNNHRVALRNKMASKCNSPVREIKHYGN